MGHAWQHHSTTEQEAVATWPLRNTQPLLELYRNGQVATAPCSVVERGIPREWPHNVKVPFAVR